MKKLDLEAARGVALRFLGYSARTKAEIEQRLARDEFPQEIIAAMVAEMEAAGYVNDEDFARHWLEDRADRKRYGKIRLMAELRRKGVDRDTATEALSAIAESDEVRRAAAAAAAKWSAEDLRNLDFESLHKEKARIYRFLAGRGFSHRTIKEVLAGMMENPE
jgi:regulatory protein